MHDLPEVNVLSSLCMPHFAFASFLPMLSLLHSPAPPSLLHANVYEAAAGMVLFWNTQRHFCRCCCCCCCCCLIKANLSSLIVLQKFRSQGGEGFEAQQSEEYDEATEEAAQLEQGIRTAQKVFDSLLEAGFVKPLQHEDANADHEQTARIGGRLVESGFGRLQFEDAMEHSRQNAEEGLLDGDSIEAAEEMIADDGSRWLDSTDRQTAEISSADSETAHFGDNKPTVHAGRTNVAGADRSKDPGNPDKAHAEEGGISKTCAGLESEPAPRQGSHFEIAATGLAGEVAELDHAQV